MSDSDSDFEREQEEERELRRKAKPVRTAVDAMNDSDGPVTAAELVALCERVLPVHDDVDTGIGLDCVAPRMAPSEITALFALARQPANRRAWCRALYACGGSQDAMASAILPSWFKLDAEQQDAVRPFILPLDVLDLCVDRAPAVTWEHVDAIVDVLRRQ